jgi:acetyl esterase/lipase
VAALSEAATLPALPLIGSGETTLGYCDNGGEVETLEVFEPSPLPTTTVPAVVYVHGGGWVEGDATVTSSSVVGQVAADVEAKGFVFVSINYRLAPTYRWPAQIDDAACAIRFLRAHASALHIDPAAIGALGDSAGGQIVSLLGLTSAAEAAAAGFDVGPYAGESSAVEAVADLYGPADLTTPDWVGDGFIQNYAAQAFGTDLGPGRAGTASTRALLTASPVTYVGPHAPPFLIVQGVQDTVVPADQSVDLAARLRAAGDPATLVMVDHAGHGLIPAAGGPMTPSLSEVASQTAAFLEAHLSPPRSTHRSR